VSRFRSSHRVPAPSDAELGIKGTLANLCFLLWFLDLKFLYRVDDRSEERQIHHTRAPAMLSIGRISRRPRRAVVLVAALLALAGCESLLGSSTGPGTPGYVAGFLGGAVADEPRAAVAAREVLSEGGTAADAATTLGFVLSVTLPSRAGLGGSGACLAYAPGRRSVNHGVPEAVLFTPVAATHGAGPADRPAAVPMLPRGLYALQARYGRLPFERLIVPAEQLARGGITVSRAFARDLALVAGPLFDDANARHVFSHDGQPLREGEQLIQPDLATTLAQLRVSGIGDFYQGGLARRVEQLSAQAGGPVAVADLRGAVPQTAAPLTLRYGNNQVAFLPPPADGGLAAAAAFEVLQNDKSATARANERALWVAARWRAGGVDAQALLASTESGPAALPPLPASTTFVTLDHDGDAVACALTMDNLFGTGRMLQGMGFLLAASPAAVPPPLLAAAMAYGEKGFRAAVAGSGQEGAPLAVADGMVNTIDTGQPMPTPVPEPGRANVIACPGYVPESPGSCGWATDPRGEGLAVGSE
jgi:gamma-glutamyltranspeptidase / glutathione hydrolase